MKSTSPRIRQFSKYCRLRVGGQSHTEGTRSASQA